MNTNKILILGGDSRLAGAFKKLYPEEAILLSKKECNILEKNAIEKAIKKYQPNYVLNCAAITDMEYCEKHPKACMEVNVIGVQVLNNVCKELNKKLIHISSDYAAVNSNIYGLSKYMSEKMITQKMLIVRTGFYDEKTFIIQELLKDHAINAYTNVFFNPISINRLVAEIVAKKNATGLINIFTDKKISFASFASNVCSVFNLKKTLVKKIVYTNKANSMYRPLNSYVEPDIKVDIRNDLREFKRYITHADN